MVGRYARYGEYQKSNHPFFEEIPSHWEVERIKFNSYVKGRQGWQNLRADEYQDDGPFLVTGAHFNGIGGVEWTRCYHVSEDRYQRDKDIWVKENDVLMTKDGSIGKIAFIGTMPDKACLNSHLLIIRALKGRYDQRYLYHLLSSCCFSGFIGLRQTGTTFFGITQEAVEEFPLLIPTITEQQAIASFLDHETGKIDTLIDKQQQLIILLKEKRQAVISHAVTKGLNPNVPTKDSGVKWLGEVPEHWRIGRCGFYLSILSGLAFPSSGFTIDESDTKLLRGINVGVSRLKWDETVYWRRSLGDGLEVYELQVWDIVMGMDRPLISEGIRVAKVEEKDLPCLLLQRVIKLKTGPQLNADYLLSLLSSGMFVAHISPDTTGVSVPHISPEQVSNFAIPVPPAIEQTGIVAHLKLRIARIDILTIKAERAITLLQERRTTLISAAVTGKIDVRNWQPDESKIPMEACT